MLEYDQLLHNLGVKGYTYNKRMSHQEGNFIMEFGTLIKDGKALDIMFRIHENVGYKMFIASGDGNPIKDIHVIDFLIEDDLIKP